MPDFALTADEFLIEEPSSPRPLRLVSTGLADTQEVPTSASKKPPAPPAYAPCPQCQRLVLSGQSPSGARLAVEVDVPTFVADWDHGAAVPTLRESRGYPAHRCDVHP